jgi:hypothetical protein
MIDNTIQHLAQQAGLADEHAEAYQRFAELIVKSCIAQCHANIAVAVGTAASAHNSGIKKCIMAISEHFHLQD